MKTLLITVIFLFFPAVLACILVKTRPELLPVQLLPNAKLIWQHWSTKALAALLAIQSGWALVPVEAYPFLPSWLPLAVGVISGLVALFGAVSKFIHQPGLPLAPALPEPAPAAVDV
jgi:hypothetical protein